MRPKDIRELKGKCRKLERLVSKHYSRDLRQYLERYENYFPDYVSTSTYQEVLDACVDSHVTYISDYHSFSPSQETAVGLMQRMAERGKKFSVCLELVPACRQSQLDGYMEGRISERRFLDAIDYDTAWGFEWKNFRPFFDFARERNFRVRAIGHPDDGCGILARCVKMAEHVAESADEPLAVVVGEAHLCPVHMPKAIDNLLRGRRKKRRHTIVLQDYGAAYWKIAEQGLEHDTKAVKLARNAYCLFSTQGFWRKFDAVPLSRVVSYVCSFKAL